MNYLVLKNIIDSLINSFSCKSCGSRVTPGDLNILGIAGNSLNLEAICPSCKTPGVIKAEIGLVANVGNPEIIKSMGPIVEALKKGIQVNINDTNGIQEDDINKFKENLKNCNSIEDLFKNQ